MIARYKNLIDCRSIPHGTITNETGSATTFINMPSYGASFSRYTQNYDRIYSQGNQAILTCDSGYVIDRKKYVKSARVLCNYTPLDGSTWKIIENDSSASQTTAACIRGNLVKIIKF